MTHPVIWAISKGIPAGIYRIKLREALLLGVKLSSVYLSVAVK